MSEKKFVSDKTHFLLLMCLFGLMGPVVRAISLPSPAIACLRAWIAGAVLIAYIILSKRDIKKEETVKSAVPMILCGVFLAIDWIGLFEAYEYTTIATATVCYYMSPVFVFAFSPLLLGEKYTLKHILCILTAFIGMMFVSGMIENGIPEISEIKGVLFALAGAAAYGGIVLVNKKRPEGDPVARTVIQLATAALLTTPYVMAKGSFSGAGIIGKDILFLAILGILFTAVTYIRYFTLILRIPARTIAIFSYADPVVAVLLSVFFLGEPISVYGIIGTVLVIGAAVLSEV